LAQLRSRRGLRSVPVELMPPPLLPGAVEAALLPVPLVPVVSLPVVPVVPVLARSVVAPPLCGVVVDEAPEPVVPAGAVP
jgi:hypothetical protein